MKPGIAITMGDPVGVGPEIILKALSKIRRIAKPLIVGDQTLLFQIAKKLNLNRPKPEEVVNLSDLDIKKIKSGHPTVETSNAMLSYIEKAVSLALNKDVSAIVTCPINKEAANFSGFKFPGHTEFIAHLTNSKNVAMMLAGASLKVILVTIHEPINKVPKLITEENILKTIKITDNAFKKHFGIKKPRIAVCGLNPHAGEGGMFGKEEKTIIAPAVKKAKKIGIHAEGPLPPDTVFFRTVKKGEFDCVVCMYHDQGLIPLKLLHFEDAVNVTLGLKIIRTSVDHGTGYDIAWKGIASPLSLIAAVEVAAGMAHREQR